MKRTAQILWIGAAGEGGWLDSPDLPEGWRVEKTSLAETLDRLEKNAGVDALVVDLGEGAGAEAVGLEKLRIAIYRQDEAVPLIVLVGEAGLPAGAARLLSDPDRAGLDAVVRRSELAAGRIRLSQVLQAGLRRAGRAENRQAVLITHGTDTMAWAFAYLRYALANLTMNIALTGSQLPLEGTFSLSDALGNLRTSVYLLNRLVPGRFFMVFNEGRHVYSGSLNKVRKWDQNAFDGRLAGAVGAEWVDFFQADWSTIVYPDQCLETLHLIRTGGTIESAPDAQGSLEPIGDFVRKYLEESLGNQFEVLVDHPELQLSRDSSNISLEDWARLARLTAKIAGCAGDTRFDPTVQVVYANPFMGEADYLRQFAACRNGVVLAGYGAGNANTLISGGRSVLPAVRQAVAEGKLVALSSQVPLGAYDMDYQVGRELVQAGGLPCGDLSLADAQIKLSYIMGHREEIEVAAGGWGWSGRGALSTAFLSGIKLRKKTSRAWLLEALAAQGCPARLLPDDVFEGQRFEVGLEKLRSEA